VSPASRMKEAHSIPFFRAKDGQQYSRLQVVAVGIEGDFSSPIWQTGRKQCRSFWSFKILASGSDRIVFYLKGGDIMGLVPTAARCAYLSFDKG
jgi:hypothetical protein